MAAITGFANPSNLSDIPDDLFYMEFIGHIVGKPETIAEVETSAKTVAKLSMTCLKFYEKCQSVLKPLKERFIEDRQCRDMGYPNEIIEALRKRNISLLRLPVLDVSYREKDFVNHLTDHDVNSPLMRYDDIWGRQGIAFRLRGKVDTIVSIVGVVNGIYTPGVAVPIRELHSTATIFRHFTKQWTFGGTSDQRQGIFSIATIYRDFHFLDHEGPMDICPTCQTLSPQTIQWACNIIKGIDPVWAIDGDIQQIEPTLSL